MLHPACKIGLAVVAFGLLLLPNAMWGQKEPARAVKDEAKLFSEKAIEEANSIIAKIKEKHHKDLLIETMDEGPAAKEAAKWASERYNNAKVDGVYMVITKKPHHFEIVVGKKTRESGLFTTADRDELVSILKGNLGKDRDEALLLVAKFTLDALNKRTSAKPGGEFTKLIGEWLGPPVDVAVRAKKLNAIPDITVKGQLYLRFSEIRNKPYLDLGYNVPNKEGPSLGVFRTCLFQMKEKGKERQIVIRNGNEDGSVVLTYELTDDTLKITSSGKVAVPDAREIVDLSGEWKRAAGK
jgi:hypothetical protein